MNKIILTLGSLLLLCSEVFAQTPCINPDGILGCYWSPKKNAQIEIYKTGDKYYGKIIWMEQPGKDLQNSNRRLRQRDITGIDLMTDFTYKNGVYREGSIYDPAIGKTYDCKMQLKRAVLEVCGYYGISQMARHDFLERIDEIAPSPSQSEKQLLVPGLKKELKTTRVPH